MNPTESATNRRVVAIMAVATGAVASNLYYPQPLEQTLTQGLHTSSAAVGVVITVIQIGYALGLATLVPLGDLVERRRLLAIMLGIAVLGLIVMATAPSIAVFGAAALLVGVMSVGAQVVVPFAAHIAAPGQQGRVVSTVMSGLLIGVLLSRTLAGLIASAAGWRAVFWVGAGLTAIIGVLLWRELPTLAPTTKLRYPALLASVLRLVREEPLLRMRIGYGACVFGSFSAFWASVGFLLGRAPYHWNNAEIGAFALLGVAGAAAATFAGRLADRGLARLATGGFVLVMALSYVLIALGAHSVIALGIGAALMDLGCQGTHISNQGLIYPLRPEARSRLNTAYMTAYFVAGATGSALSVAMYAVFGWAGACVVGAAFPVLACVLWVLDMTWLRGRGVPSAPTV